MDAETVMPSRYALSRSSRSGQGFRLFKLGLLIALLLLSIHVDAAIVRVGPMRPVATVAQAAALAKDGDIVEIDAGEYRGDVALWQQKKLTLRGVGGRAVMVADGKAMEGKAIWVIRSGDFIVHNVEFRGARVPDGNGAGIRFEGGRLLIKDCVFLDNQNGVLTSHNATAVLTVQNSLFGRAPPQKRPLPHLLYVGRIAELHVSGSRFHGGHYGHLLKSRSRRSTLRYNLLVDGDGGQASYQAEFPNGGEVTLVGNVIGKSATPQNPTLVAYGAEGYSWPSNRLGMVHNTLVAEGWRPALFLRVFNAPPDTPVVTRNNLMVGMGLATWPLFGDHDGNRSIILPFLADTAAMDFTLQAPWWMRPWLVPVAVDNPLWAVDAEFALPLGTQTLSADGPIALGALQSRSTPTFSRRK